MSGDPLIVNGKETNRKERKKGHRIYTSGHPTSDNGYSPL